MSKSSDPIGKLWEYFVGAILTLVLLPLALAVLLQLLGEVARDLGLGVLHLLPGAVAGLGSSTLLGIFLVGVAVRLRDGVRARRHGRSQTEAVRRARQVRRPAEGVPAHQPPAAAEDPDPAVNDSGEEA